MQLSVAVVLKSKILKACKFVKPALPQMIAKYEYALWSITFFKAVDLWKTFRYYCRYAAMEQCFFKKLRTAGKIVITDRQLRSNILLKSCGSQFLRVAEL
jgi:hypothetical protein